MKYPFLAAAAIGALSVQAGAATTSYADFASFSAALDASVTDDYENPGYAFTNSNAAMSAVLGETNYESTGFPNWNLVVTGANGSKIYCGGCNGSFRLNFDSTSVGTANGVFGVSFDYGENDYSPPPYGAFVTFGDGSTQDFGLLGAGFFGLTSDKLIRSLHLGLPGGGATTVGYFELDNLTIGSAATPAVPEPASWALLIAGFALAGGALRTRRKLAFA